MANGHFNMGVRDQKSFRREVRDVGKPGDSLAVRDSKARPPERQPDRVLQGVMPRIPGLGSPRARLGVITEGVKGSLA